MTDYIGESLNHHCGYFYTVKERLYHTQTKYQDLEIIDTEQHGKVMLLDKITQVGTINDSYYHEVMVHPALICLEKPKSICIIGAGDGGIAREVLRHEPEEVVQCELDGEVIDVCKKHLPEISNGAFDNKRVRLQIGDGRAYIEKTSDTFDAIIMDMTDPFGPSSMLYTQEFFTAIKARLRNEHSLFVMHSESPLARPQCYQQILHTLSTVWSHQHVFYIYIPMYGVYWSIAVSCDHDTPQSIAQEEIEKRLENRGITECEVYSADMHAAMQITTPHIMRIREKAKNLPLITDAKHRFLDDFDDEDQRVQVSDNG